MNENNGYAVYFFPQALESLGDAIKPYLREGPSGPHVQCSAIDTGGALIEMTLSSMTADGKTAIAELMVPSGMVRMVVSTLNDELFGFGQHAKSKNLPSDADPLQTLVLSGTVTDLSNPTSNK